MREITLNEINSVSGAGPFGEAGGALTVAAAALGVLAFIAAPEIALPLAIAAGATGGFGGVLSILDAGLINVE
jgi:hypothetical protein